MDNHQRIRRRVARDGLRAAVLAAAVNLLVLGAGRIAGVPFQVPAWDPAAGTVQVGGWQVVIFTVLPLLLGTALVAVLAARGGHGIRGLLALAALVTVLSLAAPLTLATDTATKLLLALMHPVAGAAFLAPMRRYAERDRTTAPALTAADPRA